MPVSLQSHSFAASTVRPRLDLSVRGEHTIRPLSADLIAIFLSFAVSFPLFFLSFLVLRDAHCSACPSSAIHNHLKTGVFRLPINLFPNRSLFNGKSLKDFESALSISIERV
jgi:hypothetical protein